MKAYPGGKRVISPGDFIGCRGVVKAFVRAGGLVNGKAK